MSIEKALIHRVAKPWGRTDLMPWSPAPADGDRIGELWFERADPAAPAAALLLKLLFTSEPLSIQVHPDDDTAHAMGLPNGKTEAWVVLAAEADAQLGLGLRESISPQALRLAIDNGSIGALLDWRPTHAGEATLVPAGTIHAIGAGIVLAEIQQRSDATFRLFDQGRDREIHIEAALVAANLEPLPMALPPLPRNDVRTILVESPYFVLERAVLPANSSWRINVRQENWLLVLGGALSGEGVSVSVGEGAFLDAGTTDLIVGPDGANVLLAYVGASAQNNLLKPIPRLVSSRSFETSPPDVGRHPAPFPLTSRGARA